ncbi:MULTISPECIES: hypothetical protein [Aeromonas]|uniref:hypothetical protein n=1 Tax=Aeromonas TaxID=642 RepID=UPI001116DC46|nr:hypothetical protein [Aeromonas dhakensis]TNI23579.1 hypothetical protein CF132_02010 [Aeromonas dhakensis]
MNFSDKKDDRLSKKCTVRAFKVNVDTTDILFNQVKKSNKFVVNNTIKISSEQHLKLKEFSTSNKCHYLFFSIFNPKEQVSITPASPKSNDLLDIENLDNLHAFIMIKGNKIASLMHISTNWCEVKLSKIFSNFGIDIKPSPILRKDVIRKIRDDGFRALHVNISVEETDFIKTPGFFESLIQKEPAVKNTGIHGHLTIDARGNSDIARSIEKNTAIWVGDLDSDFYLETKKGDKLQGDDLKTTRIYFTVPYGSKSISSKHAQEILIDFVKNEL